MFVYEISGCGFESSCSQFEKYDTEITVILPKSCQRYFTSKFITDEIELVTGEQEQIRIGILNRSLTGTVIIKKNKPFGFFILESKGEVNMKHKMAKNRKINLVGNIEKGHIKAVF